MGNENDSWLKYLGIDVDNILTNVVSGSHLTTEAGADSPAAKAPSSGGGLGISASVGKGGKNKPADVKAVQAALNDLAGAGLNVDGDCHALTIKAIKAFQKSLGQSHPDGRVDPGKATEAALAGHRAADPGAALMAKGQDWEGLFDSVVEEVEEFGNNLLNPAEASGAESESEVDSKRVEIIADSILKKLKSHGSLKAQVQVLEGKDMRTLLAIMDKLDAAGKLQKFADEAETHDPKVGAAIFTVLQEFEGPWKDCVSKLSSEDLPAVLERTPDEVKKSSGFGTDPEEPDEKTDDEDKGKGTITVGRELTVEASIGFESEYANFGTTEFTVKLGPSGNLKAVDLDLTLIGGKLNTAGPFADLLEVEASLNLSTSVELTEEETRTVFEGVREALKAQLQVGLKQSRLKGVKLQVSASGGADGVTFGGGLVIKLPGRRH